ncbi:hypothetical protein EJB05_47720, partial [Eragrostis curvula]
MDGPGAPLDRISTLPDDLLHVILTFLGDAAAVTRTAALSRRWRHVWVHAKNLSFDYRDLRNKTVHGHLAGFVDWALAQRGNVDMESLKIRISEQGDISTEKINEWLRYATQHVVKSVDVHLRTPKTRQQAAIELPSHGRTTSISLFLWGRRFQLPSAGTARYEALTELSLRLLSFTNCAGNNRGDFVSSCCPRLRRLQIVLPKGLLRLVLRSEALEKLDIYGADYLRTLDVIAPNLNVVRLASCFHNRNIGAYGYEDDVNKVARIVAPRLQDLEISFLSNGPPGPRLELDIHDLATKCSGVEHIEVSLEHLEARVIGNNDLIDLTTEGMAAQFAKDIRRWKCFCDDLEDKLKIHRSVVLEMLEDVIITGFTGADEEMKLVSLFFESSNSIKCMALSETLGKIDIAALIQKIGKEVESNYTLLHKLMNIPCANRGHWHFVEQVFVWTCYATEKSTSIGQRKMY